MNPAIGPIDAHNASHDRLLKPNELAHRHSCSMGRLANQRSAGVGVPYIKIGSLVRYRLADVLAYEAANLVEVAA